MHQAYELNARTWRADQTAALGHEATLDDLDDGFLDGLVDNGFTWLYLFGVWKTGERCRQHSLNDPALMQQLKSILPGFTTADVGASPRAIAGYEVDPSLGGDEALARLRDRARACGLSLMLDFIPNHIGLDHPWTTEHPEWLIAGNEHLAHTDPLAWVAQDGRVFAHGRDPFFAPWRDTVQIDYANPAAQEAVIREATTAAAKCDGLRCEEAMLLLPDVFHGTWRRTMEPFWRRCIDAVRAEHPGTLFLAEVYWSREWELQQVGFDFTYDKIHYDRLLNDDAERIRGHLRAQMDYQSHCIRFLENDDEQRAAARFSNTDHYRGALFLTGMVPGMLLCHHGQEQGRRIHCPHRSLRRPPEEGSEAHRNAYRELQRMLSEPARHDGTWTLLEPLDGGGHSLIGCLWTLPGYHSVLVVVNAAWHEAVGHVEAGPLALRDQQFQDFLSGTIPFTLTAEALAKTGIAIALPPWGGVAYRILSLR